MAFQRTFMRGPENCSEADVWGSLESSDLDIIIFKRSQKNLWEKNIKATFIINLKGNAGQQCSWSHALGWPWRLIRDSCNSLCNCSQYFAVCQTYNFWLPAAKHVDLWLNFCYHKCQGNCSKVSQSHHTMPGLFKKWITLPPDSTVCFVNTYPLDSFLSGG